MTEFNLLRSCTVLTLAALIALPRTGHARQAPPPESDGATGPANQRPAPGTCPFVLDFGTGDLSGPPAEYARTAELASVAPLRSRLSRRTSDEARLQLCATPDRMPWSRGLHPNREPTGRALEAILPTASLTRNSAYPDDRNNGAVWAGRGASGEVTGGLAFRWGKFSGALLPSYTYQENRDFEIVSTVRPPGHSFYIYPWHPSRIDWPQRFGELPYREWHPGQSYLRVEDRSLSLTLSTENLWWGPAQRYPLLLGNTAPGFPHLAFGTARPRDIRIGTIEARALWGRLDESPYFDGDPTNDARLIAGMGVEVQPYFLPGLYLGFARLHLLELDGLAFPRRLLAPFVTMGGGDEPSYDDHPAYRLLSFSGRWVFPEAGFEAYAEWATRAHWSGLSDFLREPGRGQAYLLGFQYVKPAGRNWLRTYGEIVQLASSPKLPREGGPNSFYTHPRVRQGHTHRGQLLGAAIGPGSDAQILGLDLITPWTTIGVFAERTRRDEDSYFTIWTRYYGRDAHDIALRAGVRQLLFFGPFSVDWSLGYEDRRNRNFLRLDGQNWDLLREYNLGLQLQVGWRPGSARYSFKPAVFAASRGEE